MPANIYYIEGNDENFSESTINLLREKAEYVIEKDFDHYYITNFGGNGEKLSFSGSDKGREFKNVLFPKIYDTDGSLMDLDYPNFFMNNDNNVGLHEIMIDSFNGETKALIKASNKRIIIILSTIHNSGAQEFYDKSAYYSTYVLYDLTIEEIFESEIE